jgi:hypothetical protein
MSVAHSAGFGTQGPFKELKSALLERPLCGESSHSANGCFVLLAAYIFKTNQARDTFIPRKILMVDYGVAI